MGHKLEGSFHVVEEGMYVCRREGNGGGDAGMDEGQVNGILGRSSRTVHLQGVR
jgi:hypothetical protein